MKTNTTKAPEYYFESYFKCECGDKTGLEIYLEKIEAETILAKKWMLQEEGEKKNIPSLANYVHYVLEAEKEMERYSSNLADSICSDENILSGLTRIFPYHAYKMIEYGIEHLIQRFYLEHKGFDTEKYGHLIMSDIMSIQSYYDTMEDKKLKIMSEKDKLFAEFCLERDIDYLKIVSLAHIFPECLEKMGKSKEEVKEIVGELVDNFKLTEFKEDILLLIENKNKAVNGK